MFRRGASLLKTRGKLHRAIVDINFFSLLTLSVIGLLLIATIFAALYFAFDRSRIVSIRDAIYLSISTLLSFGIIETSPSNEGGIYLRIAESLFGTIYMSMLTAILVFKLLAVSSNVIAIEDQAIFTRNDNRTDDYSIRIRIINMFNSPLVDVDIKLFLRVWIKGKSKFATWDLLLKRDSIPSMDTGVPWFVASKPSASETQIDLEKDDGKRRAIVFHPSYLNEKYVPKEAMRKQIILKVVIKGTVPVLNTTVIAQKGYTFDNIICGKHMLIEPKPGVYLLKNWNKNRISDHRDCNCCLFEKECSFCSKGISEKKMTYLD